MRTLVAVLIVAFAVPAAAQDEPLLLEYPEGPIVNSNRVMGLGGAYVGVAEGGDGHIYNPASFAYRYNYTRNDIWDWDWSFYTLTLPGNQNPDLYGGESETLRSSWLGGGLDLKIAGFGTGFHVDLLTYSLLPVDGDALVFVGNLSFGWGLAYALHTLDVTLGAYVYAFQWVADVIDENSVVRDELTTRGAGSRIGLLWAPRGRPLRIGLVYRTSFNATGVSVTNPDYFEREPEGVYLPGQLSLGGSIMMWERKYNPNMTWGLKGLEDERPVEPGDELRRYVMVAYDVVFTEGPPDGTVSMRGFFHDPDNPIPIKPDGTYSFRIGLESEMWANQLQLRTGYYFEPARTEVIRGRHHVTGGFAFRIPVRWLLKFVPYDIRLDAAIDYARNYLNWGIGAGFWH